MLGAMDLNEAPQKKSFIIGAMTRNIIRTEKESHGHALLLRVHVSCLER